MRRTGCLRFRLFPPRHQLLSVARRPPVPGVLSFFAKLSSIAVFGSRAALLELRLRPVPIRFGRCPRTHQSSNIRGRPPGQHATDSAASVERVPPIGSVNLPAKVRFERAPFAMGPPVSPFVAGWGARDPVPLVEAHRQGTSTYVWLRVRVPRHRPRPEKRRIGRPVVFQTAWI